MVAMQRNAGSSLLDQGAERGGPRGREVDCAHRVMFIANLCVQVIGTGGGGGKKKKGRGAPGRVYESHEDPGWESEVRTREEEVAAYEERIMIKEFRERLAFNLNKVGPAWGGSSQINIRTPLDTSGCNACFILPFNYVSHKLMVRQKIQ
jgi:hypothetical protein